MARQVRYHTSFREDLAVRIEWLRRNRPPEHLANLRAALASFKERIGQLPGLGHQGEVRRTRSYRFLPIGGRLPYLVWYYYDTADERAPVWLAMLMHEAQDRERFDPGRFE